MRLDKLVIKKFRSIKEADISLGDLNAVVGQNNSGKSCLMRALNAFFNYTEEEAAFSEGAHSYANGTVSKIEAHFTDLDEIEIPAKYKQYKNQKFIRIEASFRLLREGRGCKRTIKYYKKNSWVTDGSVLDAILKHINFVLIPPNRHASQLVSLEENVFGQLVSKRMSNATKSRDTYSRSFKKGIEKLENGELNKLARDVNRSIPINNPFRFKIAYRGEVLYSDFLSRLSISIDEHGLTQPLSECGSGIQSLAIIALYNQLAKLSEQKIIVGLEEPETNLHPQAQRELLAYFKKLIEQGNVSQFLFTTHSSAMIDQIDHQDVILFWKKKDESRGFRSEVRKLKPNFYRRHELKEFNYRSFYRYKNSDIFFSKYIVVTESPTEIEVIKRLGRKTSNQYDVNGLTYLSLDGINNSIYLFALLNELEIPYLAILDKDFFFPYANDGNKESRDTRGFPRYKNKIAKERRLKYLLPEKLDRSSLAIYANSNHKKIQDSLEKFGVISMKYNLETDIVTSRAAREFLYDHLQINREERITSKLLVDHRSAIKKPALIYDVIENISPKSWPKSFQRINRTMKSIAKKLAKKT